MSVLDDVQDYIGAYVATSDENKLILALHVIHTWSFSYGVPLTTPYLNIVSSGPACGKSITLDVLGSITRNSFPAIALTSATLFRGIDQYEQPTLMLDEVDQIWSRGRVGNKELNGVINSGYRIGSSVPRIVKGEVVKFNTFCPKILAGINDVNSSLPATVTSRCIPIVLRKKTADQKVTPFFAVKAADRIEPLLMRIEAWLDQNAETLKTYDVEPIQGLSDRSAEISYSLLAIADRFGRRDEAIAAIKTAYIEFERLNTDGPVKLLQAISDVFTIEGDKIHAQDVFDYFSDVKTTAELNDILLPFDISAVPVRKGGFVQRGFKLSQFERVFVENRVVTV